MPCHSYQNLIGNFRFEKMYTKRKFLAPIFYFLCCSVYAQEISSLTSKTETAFVGKAVSVVLSLKNGVSANSYCGLELNFGDGVIQTMRTQQSDANLISIDLTHTYTSPGSYVVSADGKYYFRGIYSAAGCSGQSKQVVINVIDEEIEKSKEEAKNQIKILAEKELELQRKEKELQAMQFQLISSRESELQRKEAELQQKLEQVDREKQMSLQSPIRREKKVEYQNQAPEKINVPRAKPSAVVPIQIPVQVSSPVPPTTPMSVKGYKAVDGF